MALIDQNMLGKNYTAEQYRQALIDTAIVAGLVTGAGTTISHPLVSKKIPATGRIIPESDIVFDDTQRILEEGEKSKAEYQAKKKAEAQAIEQPPVEHQPIEQRPVEPQPGETPATGRIIPESDIITLEQDKERSFRNKLHHQALERQRQIDETFFEEVEPETPKPVAPRHYGFMEDMIIHFEGPSKIKDSEGQVVGRAKSQRPKWLQDAMAEAGYKYADILRIIKKAKTGALLTEKQRTFLDGLAEASRRDYEKYGRLEIYLDDMQEGDKFIVDGETFTHRGYDDEGNAVIKDGITYKVPAFDRDQKVMVDDYIETQEAGEADTGGYAESINRDRYRGFLADRQKKGLMDTIDEHRLNELLNAYENFPIGGEIVTKLGEKVRFKPSEGKSVDDYVHHFLVKYSKGHNKDFYSQKYLDLVNEIPDTVKNYNDRILGEVDGKERIYYVRKLQADAKRPHHIIVVTTDAAGNFIGWTHFAGKEGYKRNLLFAEKEAVDKYGLVDRKGEIVNLNYEEYANEKRRTLLYLASNAQKAHHKRQESPLPSGKIIPPSEKSVKAVSLIHGTNAELKDVRDLNFGKRGAIYLFDEREGINFDAVKKEKNYYV